jgi:hypothetical protein
MRSCSAACPFNSNHVYLQLLNVRVTARGVSTLQTGKRRNARLLASSDGRGDEAKPAKLIR